MSRLSNPASRSCSPSWSGTASRGSAAPEASSSSKSLSAWASPRAACHRSNNGKISGRDVLARYAAALGGRLHQAIYFDDGNIAAIA